MSKLMMGFTLVLIFSLFMGMKVQADPFSRCLGLVNLESGFDSFIKLATEEQLNVSCSNVTAFTTCMSDVVTEQTGFDLKTLAIMMRGTDAGKAFNLLINMTDLVNELCTEGAPLREDYLMDVECFQNISIDVLRRCQEQAANASVIFRQVQTEAVDGQYIIERCVISAYQLGCLGAASFEECGSRAFNTYKEVVRRTGYFQSGICSSDIMQVVKTTILDRLVRLESRKPVYHAIFDIKRRRK